MDPVINTKRYIKPTSVDRKAAKQKATKALRPSKDKALKPEEDK